METQNQNTLANPVRITKLAMQEELGEQYSRCWSFAFKYASDDLEFNEQVARLGQRFNLLRSQASWFIKGAHRILVKQGSIISDEPVKLEVQTELSGFSRKPTAKPAFDYVSQTEMMAFLADLEDLLNHRDYAEHWAELERLQQIVMEQQCATEKEVLKLFHLRAVVEGELEARERFFDAYPVSTDAWENGYFDNAGNVNYW